MPTQSIPPTVLTMRLLLALVFFLSHAPTHVRAAPRIDASPASAAPHSEELHLLPAAAHPGGSVQVFGTGLYPGFPHHLRGACFNQGNVLPVTVSPSGSISATVTVDLDADAPGSCTIELWADPLTGTILVASTELTILPRLSLALEPASGAPGARISFTVRNLSPVELRLDYGGIPLAGPLSLPGETQQAAGVDYTGVFTVPNAPYPVGTALTIQAVNLVGGSPVGRANAAFTAGSPPAPVTYQLQVTGILSPALAAGAPFTLTGQITPTPPGEATLEAYFKDVEGDLLPVSDHPASFSSGGRFSVRGHLPSMPRSDAAAFNSQADLLLVMQTPQGSTSYLGAHLDSLPPDAFLEIEVRAQDTGLPLEGATIYVAEDNSQIDYHGALPSRDSQIEKWLVQFGYQQDPAFHEIFCSKPQVTTNGYGRANLVMNPWGPVANPFKEDDFSQGFLYPQPAAGVHALQKPAVAATSVSIYDASLAQSTNPAASINTADPNQWLYYVLVVDAQLLGYGELQYSANPIPTFKRMKYNLYTHVWMDENNTPVTHLIISLPRLPAEFNSFGLRATVTPTVPLVGLSQVTGADLSGASAGELKLGLSMRVFFAQNVEAITITEPTFGFKAYPQFALDDKCKNEVSAEVAFPIDPKSIKPGTYNYKIELATKSKVAPYKLYFKPVQFVDVPAWFKDPMVKFRSVATSHFTDPWDQTEITRYTLKGLGLDQADKHAEVDSTSEQANGHLGAIHNYIGADLWLSRNFDTLGETQDSKNANFTVVVLNANKAIPIGQPPATHLTKEERLDLLERSQPAAPRQPDLNLKIPIHADRFALVPPNTVPIFAVSVPLAIFPGILDVTASLASSSEAYLAYDGYVQIGDNLDFSITVDPDGTEGITAKINLSVLFNVAGFAELEVTGSGRARIPVTLSKSSLIDLGTTCFETRGSSVERVGAVCWPWSTDCLVGGEYPQTLYDIKLPQPVNSCTVQDAAPALEARAAATPPVQISLATDDGAHTMRIQPGGDRTTLISSQYNGLSWSAPISLTTGLAPLNPKLAFYAPNQALAAWAESSLTPELAATSSYTEVAKSYHLAYALWDGAHWQAKQNLTTATTGDTQVELAACPAWDQHCPPGGAVAAVWAHDRLGSPSQQAYSVVSSIFTGGSWSAAAPAPVPAGRANSTNVMPRAAYLLNGGIERLPFIAWISDADRSLVTLDDRRLATAWLTACSGPCAAELPSGLPAGLIEFSLAASPDGPARLAFTWAGSEVSLVDNRHTLYSARQECAGLTCQWQAQGLKDSAHSRSIYAEQPVLTIDAQGLGTITFRGLGFAPLSSGRQYNFPAEDALGMLSHEGDLAQAEVDFVRDQAGLHYLSNDAAVNWAVAAVYNPLQNQIVASALKGVPSARAQALREKLASQAHREPLLPTLQDSQTGLAIYAIGHQPDFAVLTAANPIANPLPTQPLTVSLQVSNQGAAWSTSSPSQRLNLAATWDGGFGQGSLGGTTSLEALEGGEVVTVTMALTHPVNFEAAHRLFLTINPTQTVSELTAANNTLAIDAGGILPPQDLSFRSVKGSRYIHLDWLPQNDARLAGYRVYRSLDGIQYIPVGSTLTDGFVDMTSEMDTVYYYTVSSYSTQGYASPRSAPLMASASSWLTFTPMIQINRP